MNGLKALVLAVDGVLTDGGIWCGPDGAEWKRFCHADVLGISLARQAGLQVALLSCDANPSIDHLAARSGITNIEKNSPDTASALRSIAERFRLRVSDLCYMGCDVNDLSAMKIAGLCAAPANAEAAVLVQANMISTRGGGNGAVREVIETLLQARENPSGRLQPRVPFGRRADDRNHASTGIVVRQAGIKRR